MNDEPKRGFGRAIMHGIMKEGLVRAECEGLSVWSANAYEMLEAIVADFHQNSKRCSKCPNHSLMGEGEGDAFICTDCLPPLEE